MLVASIGDSVNRGFTVFFAWVPALLGAIAVLIIGYFVAKLIAKLVYRAAHRAGLDRALHSGPGGNVVSKVTTHPSRLLGTIALLGDLPQCDLAGRVGAAHQGPDGVRRFCLGVPAERDRGAS